ncbi:MAG: HK97 gp10 family phage protein [Limnochordales bacterium]
MPKWGKFDFREFERLAKGLKDLEGRWDQFMEEFLLEMALRAIRRIKKRTPVGETGQLRRKWQVGQVTRQGPYLIVEIVNNTEYASFVEYGHRTGKDLTKWVEGRFMMTISMQEIERELPQYLERRVAKWLQGGGA